jgi:hypothetical protein
MQLKIIFGKKFNFITALFIIYFSLVHFFKIIFFAIGGQLLQQTIVVVN